MQNSSFFSHIVSETMGKEKGGVSSLLVQWVKDLALSLQWLGSLLWHGFKSLALGLPRAASMVKTKTRKKMANKTKQKNSVGWGKKEKGTVEKKISKISIKTERNFIDCLIGMQVIYNISFKFIAQRFSIFIDIESIKQ